jgi:hypothetical protein
VNSRASAIAFACSKINNHAAKLDINDVLRSASASIRSYFVSDFTAFWILDKDSMTCGSVWIFPSAGRHRKLHRPT